MVEDIDINPWSTWQDGMHLILEQEKEAFCSFTGYLKDGGVGGKYLWKD